MVKTCNFHLKNSSSENSCLMFLRQEGCVDSISSQAVILFYSAFKVTAAVAFITVYGTVIPFLYLEQDTVILIETPAKF